MVWKLIKWYETNQQCPEEYELYDLRDDIGETHNLAAENPQLVQDMAAEIDRVVQQTGARMPIPNPAYDPEAGPVLGCYPDARTTLKKQDGYLELSAMNKNPGFRIYDLPDHDENIIVEITLRGDTGGKGRVGWGLKTWWGRDMFQVPVHYEVKDPDSWGTYRTEIPTDEPLTRLDMNPIREARKVQIRSLLLKDLGGEVLLTLDFTSL